MCIGVALTREICSFRACIDHEIQSGQMAEGTSKVMAKLSSRDQLMKCHVGLLDWADEREKGSVRGQQMFQDARQGRFLCEHWIEKMKWPLRIYLQGMENVSKRWAMPAGKDSSRFVQVQRIDVVVGLYNNGKLIQLKNGRGTKRVSNGLSVEVSW